MKFVGSVVVASLLVALCFAGAPIPTTPATDVFVTDVSTDAVHRIDLSGPSISVFKAVTNPVGVAFDSETDELYYTSFGDTTLNRCPFSNPSACAPIVSGSPLSRPNGLSLDSSRRELWMVDGLTNSLDHLYKIELDNGNTISPLLSDLGSPVGVVFHDDWLYFSTVGSDRIERIRRDGTDRQLLLAGLDIPLQLAVDSATGKLYFTDTGTDRISRINLDGTGAKENILMGLGNPRGLAIDVASRHMYWTEVDSGTVRRINIDTLTGMETVGTGLAVPRQLALRYA